MAVECCPSHRLPNFLRVSAIVGRINFLHLARITHDDLFPYSTQSSPASIPDLEVSRKMFDSHWRTFVDLATLQSQLPMPFRAVLETWLTTHCDKRARRWPSIQRSADRNRGRNKRCPPALASHDRLCRCHQVFLFRFPSEYHHLTFPYSREVYRRKSRAVGGSSRSQIARVV